MDKTKEYLALLQKHHFWVVCGVVLIASLLSWYMASASLDKEFAAQKTLVEGTFTAMTGVAGTANHPNEKVTSKMQAEVVKIANNVYEAWKLRHDEQKKVPQWQGDLSKEFLDFVNHNPPTKKIPPWLCEEYRDFLKAEIDTLFTQVHVRDWVEIANPAAPAVGRNIPNRGNGPAGPTGVVGVDFEWKGLVAWDEQDREALRTRYFWETRPTSQQVRYANEDLWIYRALLDIINKTNTINRTQEKPEGELIKEHLLANIKKIEALNIGQLVPLPVMFFVPPVTAAAQGSEGMQPGSDGGAEGDMQAMAPPAAPGQGGSGGEGGAAGAAAMNQEEFVDATLKHLRYVDAKGKPLPYSAAEPFAEFKIMPFQMQLTMDQRKIPDLLANCANSPLPVEVRQVDVISTEAPPASMTSNAAGGAGVGAIGRGPMGGGMNNMMPGGGEGGRGGMIPGMMPGMGRGMMPGGGDGGMGMGMRQQIRMPANAGGGNPADLGMAVEMRPVDLHVEIRGVIYIFNQPDRSKVGKTVPPDQPEAANPPAEPQAGK